MSLIQLVITKVSTLIVLPCLEEDETYATRSRKLAVIALAVIASAALIGGVPFTVIGVLYDPTVGAYIVGAAMGAVIFTTSLFPYVYLRYTRKLPDWVVDFQVWSTVPTLICLNLFFHQASIPVLTSITTLLGMVMRVRGWQFYLLFGMVLSVFHALIVDFGEELPVLRSTFYDTQLLSIRVINLCGSNISPIFCFGIGLKFIMSEFVERANQADAAIRMSVDVAERLRQYDTEGVGVILTANQGKVDENLLDAFAAIQHNLQEYRPHIPDYVIAATNGTSDGADEYITEGSLSLLGPISMFSDGEFERGELGGSAISRSFDRPEANSNINSSTELNEEGSDRMARCPSSSRMKASRISDRSGGAISDSPVPSRKSRRKSSAVPDTNKNKRQHFYGRATTVFVRFVSAACGSDGGGSGSIPKSSSTSAMYILSKCIEEASAHAKAHGGALQYMQGCGLMVSFNAASRVVSHESSACTFALNLKTSIDDMSGADVVMHASIVTSNVLSFFAGNKGQLMLTVLGGFMPHHASIHHYLSNTVRASASCAIVHESVLPSIDMAFEHRLLGGISNPNPQDGTPLDAKGISELLSAKVGIDGDEEWMYHRDVKEDGDSMQVLIDGLIRRSLQTGSVPPNNLTDTFKDVDESTDLVLSRCVVDRLIRWACDEGEFVARVVPTVLW